MVKIDLKSEPNFEPGAEILAYLSWDTDSQPKSVELRVVWNTSGKGNRDIEVAQTIPLDATSWQSEKQVSLTLPEEPYSFSGRLISVQWALELVLLPSEESTRVPITIGPDASEVVMRGTGE